MKTRKESSLKSDRFAMELTSEGIIIRDESKGCHTLVPFGNINYIQIEE